MGGAACSATCIRFGGVLVDTNQWPQMLQLVAIPVGGRKRKNTPKFAGGARAASRRDQCRSRSPSEARTAMMCTAAGRREQCRGLAPPVCYPRAGLADPSRPSRTAEAM